MAVLVKTMFRVLLVSRWMQLNFTMVFQ
ncbi:Uncharacterized protein APZ42_013579 [Daphnia magna]|uniref:Uncharacterized protein n=1 Tax=Daphnia magna TaxID=35525 RepID=A0A162QLZ4_9CRUS|nr:Uncharacterized protein APZ42_013579 [Daphnia magna]